VSFGETPALVEVMLNKVRSDQKTNRRQCQSEWDLEDVHPVIKAKAMHRGWDSRHVRK